MSLNPTELIRQYRAGLSFKKDDVLRPRAGAKPPTFDVVESTVVVLEQGHLCPHEYTVVGERLSPNDPSRRFAKFTINGHEWEKVGRA